MERELLIVFVQLSPRRWIAVEASNHPHGWRSAAPANKDSRDLGFVSQTANILAGPASWPEVEQAAYTHAQRQGRTMTYEVWNARSKAIYGF